MISVCQLLPLIPGSRGSAHGYDRSPGRSRRSCGRPCRRRRYSSIMVIRIRIQVKEILLIKTHNSPTHNACHCVICITIPHLRTRTVISFIIYFSACSVKTSRHSTQARLVRVGTHLQIIRPGPGNYRTHM
jgi:hypothetical protein